MRVGDYTIEREISTDVFEATHVLLPRRVLLRVVGPDRDAAVRTMREACILEALRHPGVPRMFECGRVGDRTWVAVERVSGTPVTALPIGSVIELVRDVAAILDHAHARGITHGGVRREGIVLRKGGACLVDWREARIARAYALDIAALAELADELIAGPAPSAFTELLAEMRASDPMARPSAADVATAAAQVASELCEELDDVDLVEIDLPPPISIPTPVPLRWTPVHGVQTTPPPGAIAIATIKLRS